MDAVLAAHVPHVHRGARGPVSSAAAGMTDAGRDERLRRSNRRLALALGAVFVYWSLVMLFTDNPKAPMETFKYSIVYLALLFIALLVDHYVFPVTYTG